MELKTLKDIAKLATVCRKHGIAEITVTKDRVDFKLWDQIPIKRTKSKEKTTDEHVPIEGGFTDEDVLNWSIPQMPGNN